MAVKFLAPGGDEDFFDNALTGLVLWNNDASGNWQPASDFVHGSHVKSLQLTDAVLSKPGAVLADAGSRISLYFYFSAFPNPTTSIILASTSGLTTVARIRITSTGVLQLWDASGQLGSDGATLSTGTWYRISLAYTITSTTVNQFRVFLNGVQTISVSNATIAGTGTDTFRIQSVNSASIRWSDFYIDNSNSLTDTGDIWVTAKRPLNDGSSNTWTTRIGSGDSSYGSSHALEVNERPANAANGWSSVATNNAIEEYTIESSGAGDINISSNISIVDYLGWVYAKSTGSETGSIIVGGTTSSISLTTTPTTFLVAKGSTTYPSTGAAIGIQAPSSTALTQSLYEAGIVVAFTYNLSIAVSDSISPSDAITISKNAGFTISVGDSTPVSDSQSLTGAFILQIHLDATITGIQIV